MVQTGMDYYRRAKQRIESQQGPDRQRYRSAYNRFNQLGYQAYLRKKEEEEAEEKALEALQADLQSRLSASDKIDAKTKSTSKKDEEDEEDDGLLANILGLGKDVGKNVTHVGSSILEGIGQLGRVANPFSDYSMEDMRKAAEEKAQQNREEFTPYSGEYSSDLSREVGRATRRAGDTATFGLLGDTIERQGFDDSAFQNREGLGAGADVVYDLLGSLAPGGAIAGGLRRAGLGARTTRDMSTLQKAGQYAKEGSVAGGIYGGLEAGATEALNPEERNIYDHLRNIGLDTAFGAVADPALMGLGNLVGRGLSNLPTGNRASSTTNTFERAVDPQPVVSQIPSARNAYASNPVDNLDLNLPRFRGVDPTPTSFNINRVADPVQMARSQEPVQNAFNVQATVNPQQRRTLDDLDFQLRSQQETPTRRETIDWGNRTDVPTEESLLSRADRGLVDTSDRLRGAKVIERKIASTGSKAFENAYRDMRLVPGAVGSGTNTLQRRFYEPVRELERQGLDLREAFDYVTSKHLLDVNASNPNYTNPGGANVAQLQNRVARYSRNPLNEQFANTIQDLQQDTLDLLRREGIVSDDMYKELTEKYPNYFPLFRNIGEVKSYDEMLDIFSSGNVRRAIHELGEGGEYKIADPIDNLINYVMTAHQAAYTNRAFNHLTDLKDMKLNGQLLAKDVTGKKSNSNRTVKFKVDGQDREYELHSDLFRAYSELKTVMEPGKINRFFERVGKIQRTSITGNPFFTVKQFPRDLVEGWVNGSFSIVKDFVPAMLDMMTGGRIPGSQLDNFFQHGAGYGNIVSSDRNSHNNLLRMANRMNGAENFKEVPSHLYESTLGRFFELLRRFNEGAENVPKLAQFRATARRTGDLDQAAFEARDLMDFSMAGSEIQKLNRSVSFINANIRGKERYIRSLKDNTLSTLLKTGVAGGGMSVAAYMAYETMASDRQKELIETAPEWLRQTHWLIPNFLDPESDDLLRIPKPYEVAVVSSTPIEFALYNEHIVGPDVKEYLTEWAVEAFLVDPTLNPITPMFEAALDKSLFTNRSIENPRESHLDPEDQGDVYTSTPARWISQATGGLLSPRRADHLIQGYAPQSGENVTNVIDRLMELGGVRENEKPRGATGIENLNPFVVRGDTTYSDRIGHIYNAAEEAQALKKRTQESGEIFDMPNAYRAINTIQSEDQDLARQIRNIDNDPNLSREEKQALREDLIARRNEFANRQVSEGRTDTSEEGLARTEQEFAGLGVEPTRTDVKSALTSQLVQFGVPRHLIDEVMSNTELTNQELAQALQTLLQQYAER